MSGRSGWPRRYYRVIDWSCRSHSLPLLREQIGHPLLPCLFTSGAAGLAFSTSSQAEQLDIAPGSVPWRAVPRDPMVYRIQPQLHIAAGSVPWHADSWDPKVYRIQLPRERRNPLKGLFRVDKWNSTANNTIFRLHCTRCQEDWEAFDRLMPRDDPNVASFHPGF